MVTDDLYLRAIAAALVGLDHYITDVEYTRGYERAPHYREPYLTTLCGVVVLNHTRPWLRAGDEYFRAASFNRQGRVAGDLCPECWAVSKRRPILGREKQLSSPPRLTAGE